ncbi:MAG: hypothetical protein V1926_04985 [Candidatus Peregrinibacteria bacterium]
MISRKKIFIGSLSALFLGWLIVSGEMNTLSLIGKAFAQATTPAAGATNTIVEALGVLMGFVEYFTYLLLYIIEPLLNNQLVIDFFNKSAAGVANPLQSLWEISRDIVNILLAMALLFGAVYTIVMGNKTLVKEKAVKFVLAIVLVNFSWFFPRVILDVSNVLTATIYSLPLSSSMPECKTAYPPTGTPPKSKLGKCLIWDQPVFNPTNMGNDCPNNYYPKLGGNLCFALVPLASNANTPGAVLLGLAFNHAHVTNLSAVSYTPPPSPTGTTTFPQHVSALIQYAVRVLFQFVFAVAFFFPLLAMFVAFLVRIPVLWITIAAMPFMFVGFVIGEKFGVNTMKVWNTFLGAAFLPVFVAIPISAGFILMNAGMPFWNSPPASATALNVNMGPSLFSVITTGWQFLWLCMSFGVFWVGTFMALKTFTFTANITQGIQNWGKGLGKLALAAPLAVPILIPTTGGAKKTVSPLGILGLAKRGPQAYLDKMMYEGTAKAAEGLKIPGLSTKSPTEVGNAIKGNAIQQPKVRDFVTNINVAGIDQAGFNTEMNKLKDIIQAQGGDFHNADKVQETIRITVGDPSFSFKPDQKAKFDEWVKTI